jgi:hypothetical protein
MCDMFTSRSDSTRGRLAALRAGFGVGAGQLGFARRDMNLIPLLHVERMFSVDIWLVMLRDMQLIAVLKQRWTAPPDSRDRRGFKACYCSAESCIGDELIIVFAKHPSRRATLLLYVVTMPLTCPFCMRAFYWANVLLPMSSWIDLSI